MYMQAGRHDAGGARPAGRAVGSVGSSAERRRPLPGPGLLCQPCGGHPLLVRKSSVSYPSVLCECPVRRAERGVRSGARVPSLTRVAGHAQRSGQDGASGGGIRSRGERRGARPDSCRPACERFAGDREAGFRLARRTLRLAFGAANRARSWDLSADRVGAPTTQHRCQQPVRERYQSTPSLYLWMSQPERSFPVTVSTTHALPNLSSDSMSTRRSP